VEVGQYFHGFCCRTTDDPRGLDSIWVIVDRLTKSAHFIPINIRFSLEKLTSMYISEIVRLHGVPCSIVSDRDPRFTSRFWESLNRASGTKLRLRLAYHPQTDGQTERTIQSLEDLLLVPSKFSKESVLWHIKLHYPRLFLASTMSFMFLNFINISMILLTWSNYMLFK